MGSSMVALDLGSSGIRAVQFTPGKSKPVVDRIATAPLPRGVIERGEVKDAVALATALKELWKANKGLGKNVILGVANDNVLVRQMDVEWDTPEVFRNNLAAIVEDQLPVAVDTMTLDFHTLAEYTDEAPDGTTREMQRILLVAADREMVENMVAAVREAGLLPVKIDLNPFALIRVSQPEPATADSAEAIIDLGADVTNIVVHQGGQPVFSRTITGQAGRAINDALAQEFSWTDEEADQSKIALGLTTGFTNATNQGGPAESVFGGWEQPAAAQEEHPAQPIINEMVATFISDVRQSLEFFLSSAATVNSFSRIVLTGGASQMTNLAQRLGSELRVPVVPVNPFEAVTVKKTPSAEEVAPASLAVAVGLALGAK